MNVAVKGELFCHHPVMLQVDLSWVQLRKDFITEWNGLLVPAAFDCENLNHGARWGVHGYFWEVPTRWTACYIHEANIKSGLMWEKPVLPFVDDEYHEHVAVYHSVLRAPADETFVVAEFGARWGTWGSRAIAFWRAKHPMAPYSAFFIEADPTHCRGLEQVMAQNKMQYKLNCSYATSSMVEDWLRSVDHVDLIDMDIQGAEETIVPGILGLLDAKAYRLIIGTHGSDMHRNLTSSFRERGWSVIWDVPPQHDMRCVQTFLRGGYGKEKGTNKGLINERFKWDKMLARGCVHATPRGPVAQWDGELIVDNPRFIRPGFSMNNTQLVIDDLTSSKRLAAERHGTE